MEDFDGIADLLNLGLCDKFDTPELRDESCRDGLRERLALPVRFTDDTTDILGDLQSFSVCREILPANGPPLREMLTSPATSPTTLRAVARQAKRTSRQSDSETAQAVERAVYFAALAAAQAHHGCRITRLSHEELLMAFRHFAGVGWLLPPLPELFARAAERLKTG